MKFTALAFFIILFIFVFSPVALADEDYNGYHTAESEPIDTENIDTEAIPPIDDQDDSELPHYDSNVQAYDIIGTQSQAVNRFTGLPVNANIAYNRPIMVSFNNARAALPQFGISQADIIYEMLVEGGMTRMFALFLDVSNIGNIGSIRSMRPYMHFIGLSYRAIYVHAGGSPEAMRLITGFADRLDGVGGPGAGSFFRNPIPGRAFEHTLFTTGARINQGIHSLGIQRQLNIPGYRERLIFGDNVVPQDGRSARNVDVRFSSAGRTRFTYCSVNNIYNVYVHGNIPYVDGNNNRRVTVTNILVLQMPITGRDYAGRISFETAGYGSGYFITGGRVVDIYWRRSETWLQFAYYLKDCFDWYNPDNRTEIVFGRGRTYICIVPSLAQVSVTGLDIALRPPANFTNVRIFLDGVEFPATFRNGQYIIDPDTSPKRTATMYSFDENGLPNGMFSWRLSYANNRYTVTPIPGLQDFLTYVGYSIRIVGDSGLRAHNSIRIDVRDRLLSTGIDGFRLIEYGTLVMNNRHNVVYNYPLIKGGERTEIGRSFSLADGFDKAFRVNRQNNQIEFTSVLVDIPSTEYRTEFLFRSYAVLRRGGVDYVFYGPPVPRSIFRVAEQVLESRQFPVGSDQYYFLNRIINTP